MAKRGSDKIDRVRDKLAQLALDSAEAQFILDAFKALSADRIGMTRARKGVAEEKKEGPTMEDLMARVHATEAAHA